MTRTPITLTCPSPAAADVLAERRRQQLEEGWTHAHDDQHIRGELAAAAACYAVPSRFRDVAVRMFWPARWAKRWWKPTGAADDLEARRRDLVKAGALVIAEIERLERLGRTPSPVDQPPRIMTR